MERKTAEELLEFIEDSPSCFHVIDHIKSSLLEKGYVELKEENPWGLEKGGSYFVTRNGSSLIAFRTPKAELGGFQMIASHSDSPSFKIKENPEMEAEHQYIKLNVEKYGGMISPAWMDRPLSVAGRILVQQEDRLAVRLVDIKRDLLMIPNLAIHMKRDLNKGQELNAQIDMLPVFGDIQSKGEFRKLIAKNAEVEEESILGMDLFLYNRMKGTFWGAKEEYIASPKLDDLQCAFAAFKGFLESGQGEKASVYCIFDNEETGSQTKQGAASGFLKDTLWRITKGLGCTEEKYLAALADSFMISADNAHGVHPNHPELADPTNRPSLNGGIVIKYHANQRYTTDGVSAAIMKKLCENADVPVQTFANRSDMVGGSTLGNISSSQVAVNTVDIGLAQWAMHSPYEMAGAKDTEYLKRVAKEFYDSNIQKMEDGSIRIKNNS